MRSRAARRGVERLEGAPGPIVKLAQDRQQNLLFAVEVEVEGASRNTRARDDVGNPRPPVSLASEDPGRGFEQLVSPGVARQRCSSLI
jgi:hypothetical protein